MPKLAVLPAPETQSDLRRLAAKRDRQEQALADTRAELECVIRRAVDTEGATPTAVGRLARLDRVRVWRIVNRKDGHGTN